MLGGIREELRVFSLFRSAPFIDEQLGELRRSGGVWRGTLVLDGTVSVPLIVSGSRTAPDPEALRVARSVPSELPSWRPMIERALFEHYTPYAEAVGAGEAEPPDSRLPAIAEAPSVWPHTSMAFVHVAPLDGRLTVEIGYRVAWDEEHTLGARLRDGHLVELNGSVLLP
jgi:hypothetical protein